MFKYIPLLLPFSLDGQGFGANKFNNLERQGGREGGGGGGAEVWNV